MKRRHKFLLIAVGLAVVIAGIALFAASTNDAPVSPTVLVTDNAFIRDVDRPTVTIDTGDSVTWRWASQQSHGVSVRSGPAKFAIPVRTDGRVSHTFSKAGTYQMVCPLHAPGMKMTVVVKS